MHNIGLEVINLSALPLEYLHDDLGESWNVLSEGGLSLKDGIYPDLSSVVLQAQTPMWENHTTHHLRDGKSSFHARKQGSISLSKNNHINPPVLLVKAGKELFMQNVSFLIFPTTRTAYTAH